MLERLDQVAWETLQTHCGTGKDIPVFIKGLLSDNRDSRKQTEDELCYCLNTYDMHACEATAYVVPFILELAQNPDTPDRWRIIAMLFEFGTPPHLTNGDIWAQKAFEVFVSLGGFQLYLPFLEESDWNIRYTAIEGLCAFPSCPDAAPIVAQLFFTHLRQDPSMTTREMLLSSFFPGYLRRNQHYINPDELKGYTDYISKLFEESEGGDTRFSAALGLIRLKQETSPSEPIAYILEIIADGSSQDALYVNSVSDGILRLSELGQQRGTKALTSALAVMVSPTFVFLVADRLLGFHFLLGKAPELPLNPQQQSVLRTILDNKLVWQASEMSEMTRTLQRWGLPTTPEALQALIENSEQIKK